MAFDDGGFSHGEGNESTTYRNLVALSSILDSRFIAPDASQALEEGANIGGRGIGGLFAGHSQLKSRGLTDLYV